jgi:hypothetical protein
MTRKILILSTIALLAGALALMGAGWTWDHHAQTTAPAGFFDGN